MEARGKIDKMEARGKIDKAAVWLAGCEDGMGRYIAS